MKRGVKQKYLKYSGYLLLLNVFGGFGFFALYRNTTANTVRLFYDTLAENSSSDNASLQSRSKDTVTLGNPRDQHLVTVLLWTTYFYEEPLSALISTIEIQMKNCPVKCRFTSDKKKLGVADGLIFHSRDINSFPPNHAETQIWIYLNQESPVHTGIEIKTFSNVFNWTMTYRRDSDIYSPYGEVVPISEVLKNTAQFLNRRAIPNYNYSKVHDIFDNNLQNILKAKSKMIAWVVSNCETQSEREKFVDQLQKFVSVDIFGKCGNHKCQDCFADIEKKYKFYLSFENSLCDEYVTEKFFNILSRSIVPVVYGGANYSKIAPIGSYIDARAFNSTEDLVTYLWYLDKHPVEYLKYFTWKKYYKVIPGIGFCSLCTKLNQRNKTESKVYTNLSRWWNFKSDDKLINYVVSNSKTRNPSKSTVPNYLDNSDVTEGLTSMCFKPPEYFEESLMSKVLRQLWKTFY